MQDIPFYVTQGVKDLDIDVLAAVIEGVTIVNKKPALKKLGGEVAQKILNSDRSVLQDMPAWTEPILTQDDLRQLADPVHDNPINIAYRELQPEVERYLLPPAESLVAIIRRGNRLPTINTAVDAYNVVAVRTQLSIGAHDADLLKIEEDAEGQYGGVGFKIADGTEDFIGFGDVRISHILRGEYAAADSSGGRIICRMHMKQCDPTKVTKNTRNLFVYVQGNRATPKPYLQSAMDELKEIMTRFCGGTFRQLETQYRA